MADPEVTTPEMKDEHHSEKITVEVAYALPEEQVILEVKIKEGGTVDDAIKHSGILVSHPDIDLAVNKIGVFGKITKMTTVLRAGDRVEIYRPLIADPKEVRRKRAAEGKRMKKGGGDLSDEEAKRKAEPAEKVTDEKPAEQKPAELKSAGATDA